MQPSIIQQLGYVWLALPQEGILPLTVLEQIPQKVFQVFNAPSLTSTNGDIFDLFKKPTSGGKIPERSEPKEVPDFKGHDIVSAGAGFDIEGLKAIPQLANANLSGKFTSVSKLLYSFSNVKRISTNIILLEEFINLAKVTDSHGYQTKLKDGKIYVITDVLQATEFKIRDASDFVMDGKLDVSAVEGYLAKLSANAGGHRDDSNTMSYKNEAPITFAIKARKIQYIPETEKYSLSIKRIKVVRTLADIESVMLEMPDGESLVL